jgi:hypothetical protein
MGRGCMGYVPPPAQYNCRRHRGPAIAFGMAALEVIL